MTYQENARIKFIAFYPVKGAARIQVPSATLTETGLAVDLYADHQFMVVTDDPLFIDANAEKRPSQRGIYCFVTQRDRRNKQDKPQGLSVMALIKPQLVGDTLRLTWNYQDLVEISPDRNYGIELPVKVWDHECYATDQGDECARWLSDHLNLSVRLVKASGTFSRMAKQTYMQNDNIVLFPDAYPIHWFPIESVYELSQIANQDIPWQSFRPQIVVEGMRSQYEHKVYSGQIAGIPFVDPKPCDRCPVTLVDQETGMVREKKFDESTGKWVTEPLFSLSRYKQWRDRNGKIKVIFGENMLPLGQGRISVGDEITVTSERNPLFVYGAKV